MMCIWDVTNKRIYMGILECLIPAGLLSDQHLACETVLPYRKGTDQAKCTTGEGLNIAENGKMLKML